MPASIDTCASPADMGACTLLVKAEKVDGAPLAQVAQADMAGQAAAAEKVRWCLLVPCIIMDARP